MRYTVLKKKEIFERTANRFFVHVEEQLDFIIPNISWKANEQKERNWPLECDSSKVKWNVLGKRSGRSNGWHCYAYLTLRTTNGHLITFPIVLLVLGRIVLLIASKKSISEGPLWHLLPVQEFILKRILIRVAHREQLVSFRHAIFRRETSYSRRLTSLFFFSLFFIYIYIYPLYFIFIISLSIDLNRIPFDLNQLKVNQNWFRDLI